MKCEWVQETLIGFLFLWVNDSKKEFENGFS